MSTRQKIYIGLAVSAGVCTGVALFVYLRHRRQNALSKAPNEVAPSLTPASIIGSLKSRRGHGYDEITSNEAERAAIDSVRFQSGDIPGGGAPLTPEQAVVLIRFLDEANGDIERLHRVLTNIANSATFTENQVNITNAGGIERLREILSTAENETTKCKVLLALNNLALNDYTIQHFSGVIVVVIDLCRAASSKSLVRLYGLNLLVNMSVLEHLHGEYLRSIVDLGSLIESTFDDQAEMLAAGKILVNLSANKSNLASLLKLTGVDVKTMATLCTPKKKSSDSNEATQLEEILLRYLTFYCNLTEIILNELKLGKASEHHIYLFDPIPYGQNAVYNEIFQHDKQSTAKSVLRPQYTSHALNNQIKRFRQSLDNIRQAQFEASMKTVHDELDEPTRTPIIPDASTPKKPIFTAEEVPPPTLADSSFASVTQEMNDEFADDETILPGSSSPSSQSLASFRSAYSSNDINAFISPEKSSSS